ncbi:MAG: hypothetical protein IPJ98_16185 [Bryobacterales bacterium]|nr:hypothetical protein [Bryobacterales bacterium]
MAALAELRGNLPIQLANGRERYVNHRADVFLVGIGRQNAAHRGAADLKVRIPSKVNAVPGRT